MKADDRSTDINGKWGSVFIIGLVFAGTALLPSLADVGSGDRVLTVIFLAFFGAIITVQVIPGLMLLAAMVKGVVRALRRSPAEESADRKAD